MLIWESSEQSDDPPDGALVEATLTGDARAFSILYQRYVNRVYDFALRRVDSSQSAEDITQTTFLKAVASIAQCQNGEVFAGWLFAIARNVINDAYRARRHIRIVYAVPHDLADSADTPETTAVLSDQNRSFTAALTRCLTQQERDLLDLRLHGLSDKEIGIAVGRSEGAVRTAQYRIVRKLRLCLVECNPIKDVQHVEI